MKVRGLPGMLAPHIPRVRLREKGYRLRQSSTCCIQPASASSVGSIRSKPCGAQICQSVGDEVDVLLDGHRHVRQHRGAAGTRR